MDKFRIYIDEVGNPDLESSENPVHRFLSLTGVVLELDYAMSVLHPEMEALKGKYFRYHPDEPVIFHRADMVNAKEAFRPLVDEVVRQHFDEDLLGALERWDYVAISVCIDKKKHKETYATWRYDPYHYCLEVLLERFVFLLRQKHAQGDAMSESRGGKEDMRLKASYERLFEAGSQFVGPDQFQSALTSRQLKVKPKANNVAGLQLADLIAHPSRNEILQEQGLLPKPLAPFAQRVIRILQEKYYQREGRVYGKKFL